MLKYFLLPVLLASNLFSAAAQAPDYCRAILDQALSAWHQEGNLPKALQKLQDAETCDFANKLLADRQEVQTTLFEAIRQQKTEAEQARDAAQTSSRIAARRAREARSAALAARARERNASDPTVALNLALAAYDTDATPAALAAIAYVLKAPRTVFYNARNRFSVEAYSSARMKGDVLDRPTQPFFFLSPDGSRLALSFDDDDTTTVIRLDGPPDPLPLDDRYEYNFNTHQPVLRFAPDGSFLVTQFRNNPGKVWDLREGRMGEIRKAWSGPGVKTFGLSTGGARLLRIGKETLHIWDTQADTEIAVPYPERKHSIWKGSVTDTGDKILTITTNEVLSVWSVAGPDSMQLLARYPAEGEPEVRFRAAAFSPDGKTVLGLSRDERVLLLAADQPRLLHTFGPAWDEPDAEQVDLFRTLGQDLNGRFEPEIVSAEFSSDGSRVVTLARYLFYDPFVRVWDVASGEERFSLRGLKGLVHSAGFSREGDHLTTLSAWLSLQDGGSSLLMEPEVIRWQSRPWREPVAVAPESRLQAVGFLDDALITVDRSGQPVVRQGRSGAPLPDWRETTGGKAGTVTVAAYDRNDNLLVWYFSDGKKMAARSLPAPAGLRHLTLSTGGRQLAGSKGSTIYLLDTASPAPPRQWETAGEALTALAFSPDGRKIYAGTEDGKIRVWEVGSGMDAGSWDAFPAGEPVISIALSPDGRQVVAGSGYGAAKLWQTGNREASLTWNPLENSLNRFSGYAVYESMQPGRETIENMEVAVTAIRFSPDGRRLYLAADDEETGSTVIRAWDVRTKTPLFTLTHAGVRNILQLAVSPDGSRLLSLTEKGKAHLWMDPIGSLRSGEIHRLTAAEQEHYGLEQTDR